MWASRSVIRLVTRASSEASTCAETRRLSLGMSSSKYSLAKCASQRVGVWLLHRQALEGAVDHQMAETVRQAPTRQSQARAVFLVVGVGGGEYQPESALGRVLQ